MKTKSLSPRLLMTTATMIVLAACSSAAPASAPTAVAVPTVASTEASAPTGVPIEPTIAPTEAQSTAPETATKAPTEAPTAPAKINLNTATRDQILAIPNTGNRMVREFEEYRPYTSIVQFRREIGKYVDEAQVAEYEKYVYVPVSPNNADAATLQQLPGVTADVAAQLIAARPFASKDAFVAKLSELTSAEQANAASAFVDVQ